MDLVAGRWRWDGHALTAAFVVPDVAGTRGLGGDGEHLIWTVVPAEGDRFDIVTSTGFSRSSYLRRGFESVTVTGNIVDRQGRDTDELEVTFTGAQLAKLPGRNPTLAAGLRLSTTQVWSYQRTAFALTTADTAAGWSCPYLVGAADRTRPGR